MGYRADRSHKGGERESHNHEDHQSEPPQASLPDAPTPGIFCGVTQFGGMGRRLKRVTVIRTNKARCPHVGWAVLNTSSSALVSSGGVQRSSG
jgi:hypothetical protein